MLSVRWHLKEILNHGLNLFYEKNEQVHPAKYCK
jgi:hypothetical protein